MEGKVSLGLGFKCSVYCAGEDVAGAEAAAHAASACQGAAEMELVLSPLVPFFSVQDPGSRDATALHGSPHLS